MYGREKRVLLREYLEQGLTKTALAEKLGIHRRTIHYWIDTGQLERDLDEEAARYKARPPVERKIDSYRVSTPDENVPFVAGENVPLDSGMTGPG